MTDELIYEQRDNIGYVTLNRPQARNALTFPMYERLAEIAAAPGDVRALVITGAGEKASSARWSGAPSRPSPPPLAHAPAAAPRSRPAAICASPPPMPASAFPSPAP